MTCRLAIISSHPIQYNAPAFAGLAKEPELDVHVFYSWAGASESADPGFARAVTWDIPLLDGYSCSFVPNRSTDPGTHHFFGLDNPTMVREIRAWRPDVVLVYGWSFLTHLRVIRAFSGKVPILFRGDSTLLGDNKPMTYLARRAFLRWVYHHVDVALYVGQRNREYYLAMGLSEEQLVWAPHAVDNHRFEADGAFVETRASEWRTTLGIGKDDVVFLFAGKLIPEKDPCILLNAFIRLDTIAASRNAHLVFVGEGPLTEKLRIASWGRPNIHFLGFQNQTAMSTVYRLGNVLVLPSISETWGLAVNEAMACARPVVVSDVVGCAPDLVHSGKTGEVFPHGEESRLGEILSAISDQPEVWQKYGIEAQDFISDWSIPAYVRAVSDTATSQ